MNFFLVLPYYFGWHYTSALVDIRNIWKNFLVFFYNYFSIPVLLATLFSPWMKIQDSYRGSPSLFDTFVFNTMIRVFGIFVRLLFIILGILMLILTFLAGIVFYAVWLLMPVLFLGIAIWSFNQLII